LKIALCGYLGSGCTEVAEILAARFVLESYNTSSIIGSLRDFGSLSTSGEIDFDMVVRNKLEELLKRDNIVVEGRSAFMLLDREDMVKVFLDAPLEERVAHVAQRRGIPAEKARDDVKRSDEDRNQLMQRFLGKNALDVTNYDLSIKTSGKTYSKVAEAIAYVIESAL